MHLTLLDQKIEAAATFHRIAANQIVNRPFGAVESVRAARNLLEEVWNHMECHADFDGLVVARMMEIDNGLAAIERVLCRVG